jgi:hypothetical protein
VNITQLRSSITSLLTASPDLIGTYLLPGGQEVPAIFVVGQKRVPSEWAVAGMEVTIRQHPDLLPRAGVGIANVLKRWEVVLVQYDPDGKEVAEAMERITRRFPDAMLSYAPGDDVAYERCRIVIPDREVRTLIGYKG